MPKPSLKSIFKPAYRLAIDALPKRAHVTLDFLRFHRQLPNLDNPRTFNEKIAWRKLYDRNPRLPQMVDKVQVKEYISQKFSKNLVIPTLAVYDSAAALDFDAAPLSKPPYVLKTNHASGFNVFVKERPVDPDAIRAKLARQLKVDYAALMEEWAYSEVSRKILVEPYIDTPEGYIPDYKFHVFAGTVFAIEYVTDRFRSYLINFFDRDWKPMDIRVYAKRPRYQGDMSPPARLSEMIRLAEALGKDFPYVRVDLYEIAGAVKFGEMTFYPGGGLDRFDPPEWDEKFGQQWKQDWTVGTVGR